MIWRKTEPDLAKPAQRDAKRVLIIHLGDLGEFVRALGPAKAIREFHIGARITLLTTEAVKALAEKCPYFDMVEVDGKPKEPQAITQLIGRIRSAKYDMIYDLEGSSRTNSYFQGLRPWPPHWSGPNPNASHAYLEPDREQIHPLDAYRRQLELAGIPLDHEPLPDLSWVRMALRDPPRLRPDYFGLRGPYVLLLPRGDAAAKDRRWPEAKYVDIACRIARQGVTPVVLGGPEERDIGAAIARGEPTAKNLVTRADLFQAVGLAQKAAYVLGDDVDLMHVAAAAGAQCLAFLSTNANPERDAPRGPGGVVGFTAAVVADLPVEQVERQLRNAGVLRAERATA
ncbi:MAG: glycosyltransferase family 9 protein [Hyphomonadaceae bacterium]|nr:glycosyltransferase family 9 protein [Hyphomonadaceae bacterium]